MINDKNRWWIRGLFWSAFMYLFNIILWPVSQHEPLTARHMLIGIPIWIFAGLLVGRITYYFSPRGKTGSS